MYTSRLETGKKKEEDATTNLFTRQPYYQQYTHIYYNKLQLFKITESKSKQR